MRKSEHSINSLILNRWSSRAMSGEELTDEELMPLFEAARFAPSSNNNQPWRFIYAKRNTTHWSKFFYLLGDFNKQWCRNASALVLVVSRKKFDYNNELSITHSFDTGAAWENLALEASSRGLVAHGMQGFDYGKAREIFNISDDYNVEAMIAIGKKGSKENLPNELQEREAMSDRKPLSQIVFEGKFNEQERI